jgi:hypothetical protein
MRGAALAALVLVSCGESTTRLELDLSVNADCNAAIPSVAVLSVEVYGSDEQGSVCALARRCISVNDAQSVDDLEAAMKNVRQPLIDVENSGILQIAISGHSTNDCFEPLDRVLCGLSDLRDAADGRLPILLNCDLCPDSETFLCP